MTTKEELNAACNAMANFTADQVFKDAERYRWLRDKCSDQDVVSALMWIAYEHESLDAGIDAAIAAQQGEKES